MADMSDLKDVLLMSFPFVNAFLHQDDMSSSCLNAATIGACASIRQDQARIKGFVEGVVDAYTDTQFRQRFRMTRRAYLELEDIIDPVLHVRLYPGGRKAIPNKDKILMTLWFLATQETIRPLAERFGMAESTAHSTIAEVIDALLLLKSQYISWPSNNQIPSIVLGFSSVCGFPGVVGAIDGTHIQIKAPLEESHVYVNRKKFHSIVLQCICNDKMEFLDCYAGWPGSVHDARVWRNSPIFTNITTNPDKHLPGNKHLLGDPAYPLSLHMMTAFRDNGHLTNSQKTFNRRLSATRCVIERAFSLLKGRWRRLKYVDVTRMCKVPDMILACCVLHNHCIRYDGIGNDFEDLDPELNNEMFHEPLYPDARGGADKRAGIVAAMD